MTDGVADRPDTATLQRAVDALRGLLVKPEPKPIVDATVRMGADMLELTVDWLADQHRLIEQLSAVPVAPPSTSDLGRELVAMADQLEKAAGHAALAGGGTGVRVKDPVFLADLLRRAAEALRE